MSPDFNDFKAALPSPQGIKPPSMATPGHTGFNGIEVKIVTQPVQHGNIVQILDQTMSSERPDGFPANVLGMIKTT